MKVPRQEVTQLLERRLPGMFGGLVFADKSQMYATLRTETRANTVEMLHIKNFNDSPMSV
jgi:hypothetical protein